MLILVFTRMLRKDGWTEGRTEGSVTLSLRNFVGKGIKNWKNATIEHGYPRSSKGKQRHNYRTEKKDKIPNQI